MLVPELNEVYIPLKELNFLKYGILQIVSRCISQETESLPPPNEHWHPHIAAAFRFVSHVKRNQFGMFMFYYLAKISSVGAILFKHVADLAII
jgi:hypothetical protein